MKKIKLLKHATLKALYITSLLFIGILSVLITAAPILSVIIFDLSLLNLLWAFPVSIFLIIFGALIIDCWGGDCADD